MACGVLSHLPSCKADNQLPRKGGRDIQSVSFSILLPKTAWAWWGTTDDLDRPV